MADKRITEVDFIDSLDGNESFFINQNSAIKQINKGNIVFNVTNGGTGATTAQEARMNLGAVAVTNTIIELPVDGWENNQQVVIANNVTADNTIIIAPDTSTNNYKFYAECGVFCTAQAEGMLTFFCRKMPETTLIVNIVALS